MEREDADLVLAFRLGDEEAFEELLRRYRNLCRRLATEYYAVGYSFEDLVLEAEVGVWEAARDFDLGGASQFRAWANFVARRKVLTLVVTSNRKKARPLRGTFELYSRTIFAEVEAGRLGGTLEDPAETVMARETTRECIEEVRDKLRGLTDLERSALLGVVDGRSYEEIAEDFGVNKKRVDNALQRARRKVRVA